MCPAWLLVVAVVGVASGTASQCWEHPSCQDLSTESNMLECLQICHSDLTEETPVFPGEAHLAPVFSSSSSSSSSDPDADPQPSSLILAPASSSSLLLAAASASDPQAAVQVPVRRSYSMEHFRWGKPVGRKRRPVKTPSSSSSSDPADPPSPLLPASSSSLLVASDPQESQAVRAPARRSYHMGHFRWGKPSKRTPVKVYTLAGGDGAALEEPAESSDELGFLPSEMRRELLANEVLQGEEAEPNAAVPMVIPAEKKRDSNYKMKHFRWGGPPATKRYGGFMKSWDERAQKPLLTLFKNVIHQQDAAAEQE